MKLLLVTILVFAYGASAKAQQTTLPADFILSITCGNMMFTVPAGWKLQPDGENYALMLPPPL